MQAPLSVCTVELSAIVFLYHVEICVFVLTVSGDYKFKNDPYINRDLDRSVAINTRFTLLGINYFMA
jgi:hypothetical protein